MNYVYYLFKINPIIYIDILTILTLIEKNVILIIKFYE